MFSINTASYILYLIPLTNILNFFFQVYIVTQKIENFLEIFYVLKKLDYYQIQKTGLKIECSWFLILNLFLIKAVKISIHIGYAIFRPKLTIYPKQLQHTADKVL